MGAVGQFIRETLNSESVIDVGNRSQPTYPDMSLRRTVLDAHVGQIIGKIRPALLQVRRGAIDRVHIECGGDRRKDRSLQPGMGFPLLSTAAFRYIAATAL